MSKFTEQMRAAEWLVVLPSTSPATPNGYAESVAPHFAADLLDEAEKALAGAQTHIVMMYRGISPHANYDNEITMRGSVSGNRMADKDEMVIRLRATLARIRGEQS